MNQDLQELISNNNVYFYDIIHEDKHLGSFTESYELAMQLGWQDNYIAKDQTEQAYNGWTYLKGFKITKPLDLAKDEKHSQLKSVLEQQRQKLTVSYDNDTFDANLNAQSNMNTLIGLFSLGAEEVQIRSSTEITHTFNKEQCIELSLIMAKAVQDLYTEYWKLKDKLYSCETLEDIELL